MKKRLCLFMLGLSVLGFSATPSVLAGRASKFTCEDDKKIMEYMRSACDKRQIPNWKYVATTLLEGKFTARQCGARYRYLKKGGSIDADAYLRFVSGTRGKRRLTKEDNDRIMTYVENYLKENPLTTRIDWKPLAEEIGFTADQIRRRYNEHLKACNGEKKPWTKEMEIELLEIAPYFNGEKGPKKIVKWSNVKKFFTGYSQSGLYTKYRRLMSLNPNVPVPVHLDGNDKEKLLKAAGNKTYKMQDGKINWKNIAEKEFSNKYTALCLEANYRRFKNAELSKFTQGELNKIESILKGQK